MVASLFGNQIDIVLKGETFLVGSLIASIQNVKQIVHTDYTSILPMQILLKLH